MPVNHGYVEATATVSTATGPVARLEAGWRVAEKVGAFAFAEANRREAVAGVGLRAEF